MIAEARFWAKVNKNGPVPAHRPDLGPCWVWTAGKTGGGYGGLRLDGRDQRAHRVAYEWLVGPIPEGLELDHLCRVRHCVNPAHLEPVTHRENTLRGETIPARNAAKTHCLAGHEYEGENLYIDPRGYRECRACNRDANRRYRARRAA